MSWPGILNWDFNDGPLKDYAKAVFPLIPLKRLK